MERVILTLKSDELLYDIRNYAYIGADALDEGAEHRRHLLADAGEDGNIDCIARTLALAHSEVLQMLRRYAVQAPAADMDNSEALPANYRIELRGEGLTGERCRHLLRTVHLYMVARAMAAWTAVAGGDASQWRESVADFRDEIRRWGERGERPILRSLAPF